jgi:hypothetical protein
VITYSRFSFRHLDINVQTSRKVGDCLLSGLTVGIVWSSTRCQWGLFPILFCFETLIKDDRSLKVFGYVLHRGFDLLAFLQIPLTPKPFSQESHYLKVNELLRNSLPSCMKSIVQVLHAQVHVPHADTTLRPPILYSKDLDDPVMNSRWRWWKVASWVWR